MNKLIKVILFLIVGMVQVFAWGGLRGDTLAKELDEAVLNRSFYLQQREQRITQLKDMFLLSKISLWQEYEINHQLYEEFKKIQQDSAIYYIKRNMEIASFMKDTARIYTSRLRLATLYAFSGMYRESEGLLRSIDRELLSKEQKQNISRKICLLHELFQPVNPVCAVSVRLQWGLRVMAERMIHCLPREASSPVAVQLSDPLRTDAINKKARDDFGETVGSVLDTVSSMPLIPSPVRTVIQSVRDIVVSVARAVWNFFF